MRTQIQWIGRNVLSVKHYTCHPDFMELEHVDEVELRDALRGVYSRNLHNARQCGIAGPTSGGDHTCATSG